jgi:putative ATP-dependent endonuclease of the OLD family
VKIRSVRIQNFRGFEDETITFDGCTCLVGPNGAGKSTVLSALNVFFQEATSGTDASILTAEDFHGGNTGEPVQITVTFNQLNEEAIRDLAHYVRHGELVISSVAKFDPQSKKAPVVQWGEKLVFKQFAQFFEDEKNKTTVEPLRQRFSQVIAGLPDFPDMGKKPPTKVAMIEALRSYEEARPQLCESLRSSDQFYGVGRVKGKLEPYVQWVYLPAVKDASIEAEEAGNTALGKLLQRTVRQKVNFDEAIENLETRTRAEYAALLQGQQGALEELSASLAKRLTVFAHPDASLAVEWLGSDKSVSINEPRATIKAQEGTFKGSMTRFGHGLQRSFLLAILQELASVETSTADGSPIEKPTLILGCEEPELYQHPPQARHLSSVLRTLASHGNQIMLTTHSAYFVSGEDFEEIRLVRRDRSTGKSYVKFTDFEKFAKRIADSTGKKPDKNSVAKAKLLNALRPEPSELYFCQRLVLVEGTSDRAYISAALHLDGEWDTMRRAGLHILPTEGKSNILQLLVIAQELEIPCFIIFDADGNEVNQEKRRQHGTDNAALLAAVKSDSEPFPPSVLWGLDHIVWPTNIETEVKRCFEPTVWERVSNQARNAIDPSAGGLKKNPLLIGELLSVAWAEGLRPQVLADAIQRLKTFGAEQGVVA